MEVAWIEILPNTVIKWKWLPLTQFQRALALPGAGVKEIAEISAFLWELCTVVTAGSWWHYCGCADRRVFPLISLQLFWSLPWLLGRQHVRTKHCPHTLENVEPCKHQSQSYFRKWIHPRWHMCSPPAVWAGSRVWPLMEDFVPIHPIHPWLRLSSFPAAQDGGICLGTHQWPVACRNQVKGFISEGLHSSEVFFLCEKRSFPAEPLAPTHKQGPGSTNGAGVGINGGAKAEQIDPKPCLMEKNFQCIIQCI